MDRNQTYATRKSIGLLVITSLSLYMFLLAGLMWGRSVDHVSAAPALTTTPTPLITETPPTPPIITLTPTPPIFTATVDVLPSASSIWVGEAITVEIQIRTSEGCRYALYESSLMQDDDVLFAYVDPPTHTVGPPGARRYHLDAIAPGEMSFRALLYGESYCGYWAWRYLGGVSDPVVVAERVLAEKLFLPVISRVP